MKQQQYQLAPLHEIRTQMDRSSLFIKASRCTLRGIQYLGFFKIILALLTSFFVRNGLLAWRVVFGLLHIVFCMLMYINMKASRLVKDYFENINKDFESRTRLGNMSVLMVEDRGNFSTLQLTDCTLASHLRGMEEAAYLQVEKQYIGRKLNTRYSATPLGRVAFINQPDGLDCLIRDSKNT